MSRKGIGCVSQSKNILKLVVIQSLIGIADHGVTTSTSPDASRSQSKSSSGASLVQKRSRVEKRSAEVLDEDDGRHSGNATGGHPKGGHKDTTEVGGHDRKLAAVVGNVLNKHLTPEARNKTGGTENALSVNATPATRLNVEIHGNGLKVSSVGNLSNPHANSSGHGNPPESDQHNSISKWQSLGLVIQDWCSKIFHAIGLFVISMLVKKEWVSHSTGSDEQGSLLLIGCGMMIATALFVAIMCVHRIASRYVSVEDMDDSSTFWFQHLHDSSPFQGPNRQPWFFRSLGFAWTSRFKSISGKPMPPYSVRHGLYE